MNSVWRTSRFDDVQANSFNGQRMGGDIHRVHGVSQAWEQEQEEKER
jgi:hypothetical protein